MLHRAPAIIEGLLRIVIENTDTTIHAANACVVGQGTIGAVLTRYLVVLGAHTAVVARNPEQRAAAFVAGATPYRFEELAGIAPRLDLLFSTVPARIVDLAAPPGGVDFDCAKRLGLKAIWGRGLGSRAPVTVGASQWGGIRERIEKILLEES